MYNYNIMCGLTKAMQNVSDLFKPMQVRCSGIFLL